MDTIRKDRYDTGPKIHTRVDLAGNGNLCRETTGLFFTPTANIPAKWIGEGRLDVVLPLASTTAYEWESNPAFGVPRVWVELLQRATGKLRWTPISPAKVTIVRYDTRSFDLLTTAEGAKALVDALMVKSAARSDGSSLHYFGAIQDNNWEELTHVRYHQVLAGRHDEARTRIIVEPAPPEDAESPAIVVFPPGRGTLPC